MNVKKIFITLITIVALVVVGALILNVILPNTATALVDTAEDQIYNATKISLDLNGNGNGGGTAGNNQSAKDTNVSGSQGNGVGVNGFSDTAGSKK